MKLDRTIFEELGDDPRAEAAAAERLISHQAMTRWLKSWGTGTGKRSPKPTAGD